MRLFLAIDLPDVQKKELHGQLVSLQKEYQIFNWVQEHNYHMTVHFFGEILQPTGIVNSVKDLLYDKERFYLYALHLNYFFNHQITIFTQFKKEKRLTNLVDTLTTQFTPHRQEFIPHITVARCRIPSKQQYTLLKKKLEKTNIDLSFEVRELTLFESILSKNKPLYLKIMTFPLIQP